MNARILRNRPTVAAIITLTAAAGATNAQSVLSVSLIAPLQDMLSLHAVGVAGSGADAAVAYQALHLDGSSSVGLHGPSGFASLPGSPSSGASLSQIRAADWSWGLSQTGGTVAGSSGAGQGRATLWTLSSGSPPELHLLDDGSSSSSSVLSSVARCVTDDAQSAFGTVVSLDNGAVNSRAVAWSRSGLNFTKIEFRLADGFDSSEALACDTTGAVVAGFVSSSSTGSSRAAIWSGDSLHLYAGPDNDCDGRFVALSNDGSTALFQGACDSSGSSRSVSAIFRPSEGTWFALPGRGGEDCDDTYAFAMSADGRVVGGSSVCADGSSSATFWTFSNDAYVARDLAAVLAGSSFADQFAGVSLLSITGVSADGLTFVGDAVDSTGASMMFRVTVPTPGSAALLGLAGLLTARRRRA